MISDNLKQKLLEALKDDRITLTMLENNISRLIQTKLSYVSYIQ